MNPRQVIAYKPIYAAITGSVEAALLLSQAEYMSTRSQGKPFSKTSQEWERETGLTYWKQQTARKILSQFSFWTEYLAGNPAKLYFRVDVAELHNYVDEYIYNYENNHQECEAVLDIDDSYEDSKCEEVSETVLDTTCEPSDIKVTSIKENLELDRGNPKILVEEKPLTIIGSVLEINKKNNNNIITEIKNFGGSGKKSSHKQFTGDRMAGKTQNEAIEFFKTKIESSGLMETFGSNSSWFREEFENRKKFLFTSLAVRLGQGKVDFESLEIQIRNASSIGDLLQKLTNPKYSVSDALRDLIFVYSDGLVSSWSRESKAIKTLVEAFGNDLMAFDEVEDILIWIKKTMNFSLSLSSIIPAKDWFRRYRRHLFDNRYSCDFVFRKLNTGTLKSDDTNSDSGTLAEEDISNFFSSQRRKRG